jgi:hypothetical protein
LRDLDLSTLRRQHPDGNLQSPTGWVHDTDRPISSLRSAKNPQGNTMKRVKGVEDLNICLSALRVLWTWVPPSARPHDRARRRARQGWQPLDLVPAELLAARPRTLEAVPAAHAGEACGSTRGGRSTVLRRPCRRAASGCRLNRRLSKFILVGKRSSVLRETCPD